MKKLETRINQLEILSLGAKINGDLIDAIKYNYAALELARIKDQILIEAIEAIDQSIENLKII
jgi:hypothetical protein